MTNLMLRQFAVAMIEEFGRTLEMNPCKGNITDTLDEITLFNDVFSKIRPQLVRVSSTMWEFAMMTITMG